MIKRIEFRSLLGLLAISLFVSRTVACFGDDISEKLLTELDRFASELRTLAETEESQGHSVEAERTRSWIVPKFQDRTVLFPNTIETATLLLEAIEKGGDVQWRREFERLRHDHADRLFEIARQAIRADQESLAYSLAHRVLRERPNHVAATKLLGLPSTKAKITSRNGNVDEPKLGWRRGKYWIVESRHIRVLTDHSQKEARALVERLEMVYSAWKQVFYEFWAPPDHLSSRLAGSGGKSLASPIFEVVLFKNKAEYLRAFEAAESRIDVSLGVYLESERRAFFYVDETDSKPTWAHEGVHQFFKESKRTVGDLGAKGQACLLEAPAIYFESLDFRPTYATLGGWDSDRLQFARYRILGGTTVMPLREIMKLDRESLKRHPQVREIYTQVAAFAHWLMNSNGGARRHFLTESLSKIYSGEGGAEGFPGDELSEAWDQERQSFLQVDDALWDEAPPRRLAENLCLRKCAVSKDRLASVATLTKLKWLDLAFTNADDSVVQSLSALGALERLQLEGLSLTDEVADKLGKLDRLEEIDLSGTSVGLETAYAVGKLPRLKSAYFAGCSHFNDQALTSLEGLRRLESLDVSNTSVTPSALELYRRRRPKVKVE